MRTKPDKLSHEVNMALAAGMSYGKWKAMQTPVVVEKPVPKVKAMQVCDECGAEFPVYDNRTRKFCSEKCRLAKNARHKYEWRKKHGKTKDARSEQDLHTELQERSEEESV